MVEDNKSYGVISVGTTPRIKIVYEIANGVITEAYAFNEENRQKVSVHTGRVHGTESQLKKILECANSKRKANESLNESLSQVGI